MAQGTPNLAEYIPAGLLEQSPVRGGGSDGKQACVLLSGPQAKISRLSDFEDLDEASRAGPVNLHSPPRRADDLAEADRGNLNAILDHEIAPNTMKNYRVQWSNFIMWAVGKGIRALPADPVQVAAYLAERMEEQGHKPATLRAVAAAIAFVHKAAGVYDPCASPEVKRTLRSATRKAGRGQKQAEALTAEALTAIRSTACNPRRGRGGSFESMETARCRGNLDVALISLMRDAMLRVSEAAALTWGDIVAEVDGTGRLLIRRSKTDAEGREPSPSCPPPRWRRSS